MSDMVHGCLTWFMPKYGVFYGLNTGKYGPEKTPYLETFHAVNNIM